MTNLERAMIDAIPAAQAAYEEMTGWWLYHGPESFLQFEIARNIVRKQKGLRVFAEASPKKIAAEFEKIGPGRPYDERKRFDLIVWQKSAANVAAVIELKRARRIDPIILDAKKVRSYLRHARAAKVGYLVVYTDINDRNGRRNAADRRKALNVRFASWEQDLNRTGWKKVEAQPFSPSRKFAENPDGRSVWSWGFAIFRLSRTIARKQKRRAPT